MTTAALLAVVVVAIALLGAVLVGGPLADGWHNVANVNGTTINRSELRARIALDARIAAGRLAWLRTLEAAGRITPEESERIRSEVEIGGSDPVRAAIDGLIDDQLIRSNELAGGSGTGDVEAELTAAVRGIAAVRVVVTSVTDPGDAGPASDDWRGPAGRSATPDAARETSLAAAKRVSQAIAEGMPTDEIRVHLEESGWRVTLWDRWLPATGAAAGLPDELVAAAQAAESPGPLEPVVDEVSGTAAAGKVIDVATDLPKVERDGLDGTALDHWARARSAERAIRGGLARRWQAPDLRQVRALELVVGELATEGAEGDYRSFRHLVVRHLPQEERGSGDAGADATALAGELRALDPESRRQRFDALVGKAAVGATGLELSGPTPFYTREQVLPALAEAAWAESTKPGDVVGPIETSVGPELFLVEGHYSGSLDERANAALLEAASTADLLSLARRISPDGEWPRAAGLWRAEDELIGETSLAVAYDAPGQRTPVSIEGRLVVVEPVEHRAAPATAAELARLSLHGFEAWLAQQLRQATISRDREPLPGVLVASPSPSDQPTASSGDIPTPNLPSIPSAP